MSLWNLTWRSLTHYWRIHAAVLAGVVVTAAVLSGAFVVGDSVKESLKRRALERIAEVRWAVIGNDRFFTEGLAERLGSQLGAVSTGIVQVVGSVANGDGSARANGVQVIGVDDAFWALGGGGSVAMNGVDNFLGVNEALARRLGVAEGENVVARVEIPGSVSRDAPLSGETDQTVGIRRKVTRIVKGTGMGSYALRNEQTSPLNLYVDRAYLQELLEKPGHINVILIGEAKGGEGRDLESWEMEDALARQWILADASLQIEKIHGGNKWKLSSDRVFIDRKISEAVREVAGPSDGVLTYFVNGIRHGEDETPYSTVTAAGSQTHSLFPDELPEDGMIVSEWLAADLDLETGDEVEIRYFIVMNGRDLVEETAKFRVAGVLPMSSPELNADWSPQFPGLAGAESCGDWEPGVPVDLDALGDEDQKYWEEHRLTPKAFISLQAGQQLWENRFGDLTGIQFLTGRLDEQGFEAALKERLRPADFGLQLRNVRGEAEAAVADSLDFGVLFAAMSFFLVVAALILTGLLFAFGVEQRADQIGLCLALGIPKRRVRAWFLTEAAVISVLGAVAGTVAGILYTRIALWGLSGIWAEAVAGMQFVYHANLSSLAGAAIGSVALSMAVVYIASRILMRIEPKALISGSYAVGRVWRKPLVKCVSFWLGLAMLLGGVGMVFAPAATSQAEQEAFFGSGSMLLIAGVCGCILTWRAMEQRGERWKGSLWALGRSYALGRKGRSLSIVAIMAAGVFMVTATNSMRLNARAGAGANRSGTGGFLYVGESTLPVYENLNAEGPREEFGLSANDEFSILQARVSGGDDASCLNLNRAQKPRLIGIDPAMLAERGSFSFVKVLDGFEEGSPWLALNEATAGEKVVPGVIDANTAMYALGKKLGSVVEYDDARGNKFRVRLVALMANSVLQGNILISEKAFVEKFPDSGGFRMFFLDAPNAEEGGRVAGKLSRMLVDRGFAMMPAWERLAEFNAVQNTYLSIFSTLGGLGVLLGTVGLAVLVGRNVLERRGQLGLMRAMGFEIRDLAKLVLAEHWFLHVLGVLLGLSAALVAVSAQLTERGSDTPLGLLAAIVAGILAAGLLFCWIAARIVVRFPLLESLRNE